MIFCGAVYAFFALAPEIRVGLRALLLSLAVLGDHDRALPARARALGPDRHGRQLPRVAAVPPAEPQPDLLPRRPCRARSGSARLRAGSPEPDRTRRRRRWTWRETLLACWIGVPVAFLELWPVKGFQYLLPIAPVVAVLAADGCVIAARLIARSVATFRRAPCGSSWWLLCSSRSQCRPTRRSRPPHEWPSWRARAAFRAAARRAASIRANVPEGATMLAIGPSMANILEFYGHRTRLRALGQPEPPAPQPDLPGGRQPRPLAAPRRHPVHRLGRVLGAPQHALRAATAELRLALPRPRRLHVQHACPGEGRSPHARAADHRLRGAPVKRCSDRAPRAWPLRRSWPRRPTRVRRPLRSATSSC